MAREKSLTQIQIEESLNFFLQDGLFRCDNASNIVFVNHVFVKIFGYEVDQDLLNRNCQSLLADGAEFKRIIDRIKEEGFISNRRTLCKRKDGTNFWTQITLKREFRNGREVYEGLLCDITELIRLEQSLIDTKMKYEKLSMELDNFIYSASHDIRSPISTVMGILNIMKMDIADPTSIKYITMMRSSVGKLNDFVEELTSYAKNSKKAIDDERIDFKELVNEIINDYKERHPFFNLIIWSIEVYDINAFYSDKDRVALIINNVIKNALDYCDQQKSKSVVSLRIQTSPLNVSVEIFDNGIGIARLHLDKVFDMFYRGTDHSKGSGIGLYLAREAATKLGGTISLNSEYGVGTSLKIELPNSRKGKLINKKLQLVKSPSH